MGLSAFRWLPKELDFIRIDWIFPYRNGTLQPTKKPQGWPRSSPTHSSATLRDHRSHETNPARGIVQGYLRRKSMRSMVLLSSRLCGLVLLFTSFVHAQVGTSGEISGTVVDQSGAVVVKASVVAVETAKGIQHSTISDESGHYRFSGLPPATYSVTAESKGFAPEQRKGVTVTLGE